MSVPATAVYNGGIACTPDGAVYVQMIDGGTQANPIFTGVASFADGSKAAPSITFTNSTGNGWFWRSGLAGAYAGNSGKEIVQIGSSGNLYLAGNELGLVAGGGGDLSTGGATSTIASTVANSFRFGGLTASLATSRTEINKAVTAFTNAVAKAVFTITIPNAAHSASIMVRVTGSLGAGGAIGANEATATNCYVISLTRTAGVNATAAISAAFGAAATAVAGAATVTCTAAMSSVSGAVGDPNTFTVDVTITRSGGSSDNHTCVAHASLLNANATGITIA